MCCVRLFFFFQAEDGIRDIGVTGVQTCALPISADSIGRHMSSTVMAELGSGLASDINKLVIEDLEIKHEHKTKGRPIMYEKTLEMYRPDFSGFLWTTILCLDNRNPAIKRDYHPQACSIIPGVFAPLERDPSRKGIIIKYTPN